MAREGQELGHSWLLYAVRTPVCAPLDRRAYPEAVYHDGVTPWPDWACRSPDGGIHTDNRLGSIDVNLAAMPTNRGQISWTCEFQVTLVARSWLSAFEDLIDPDKTWIGQVLVGG